MSPRPPSGWKMMSLKQAQVDLFDCEHKTPAPAAKGVPYITIPEMRAGRLEVKSARLVAERDVPLWNRRVEPQAGDVIVSRRTNPGVSAVVPPDLRCVLGQNLVILRSRGAVIDQRFLRWLVRGPGWWQQIEKYLNVGAVFDSLRCADIPHFELLVPPLEEQRQIAGILGTLDDKIELNRRMSETLEAMARALFKSWFVDFEPVRAKSEGRDPGLPKPLAELFPDSFEDSALGEIPERWELVPLPEVVEVNPSRSLRKGAVVPYLDMANMPTRGHTPDAVVDRPLGSGTRFINGDTLVARITPCLENGKTAFVDFLAEDQVGWGSTEYIVLRPKPPLPAEFAYCLARSAEFREFAIQSMTGSSGRQRVPAESMAQYSIAKPTRDIAEQFGRAVKPLFARATECARESRTLAAVRDALLPRLILGEVGVDRMGQSAEALAFKPFNDGGR